MSEESKAMAAIEVDAPKLTIEAVAESIEAQFGLTGKFESLVSERDQNFMLQALDGGKYVAKVTSILEEPLATDFQIRALLHLKDRCEPAVPRVVRTRSGKPAGEIAGGSGSHCLRVVTWVDGGLLETRELDESNVTRFGRALAQLDIAFDTFSHPGEKPALLWDLQRVCELRKLVEFIDVPAVQNSVTRAIRDYEQHVVPALGHLRSQVIHSDANPGNVLLSEEGVGFIDFGDIIKAPLVFEVAIAASYVRSHDEDPLRYLVPFIAAYHEVLPLTGVEAELLFYLIRARLSTTITLLYWRLGARDSSDPYRQKALSLEGDAEKFLAALDAMGPAVFRRKLFFIQ